MANDYREQQEGADAMAKSEQENTGDQTTDSQVGQPTPDTSTDEQSSGEGMGEDSSTMQDQGSATPNAGSQSDEALSEEEEFNRLQTKRTNMPLNGEEINRYDELKAKLGK